MRGRKGMPVATSIGGVEVVEAPAAFSTAQASKAKRARPKASKVALNGGGSGDGTSVGRKRQRSPEWEREYQQIWKTVNELGAEQFTGKDKKAYEARKIVERGGRAPKEVRMPLPVLQGIRKKAKEREERREAMEAEAGVVTGKVIGSARKASAQTNRGQGNSGGRRSGSAGVSRGGSGLGAGRDRAKPSAGPAPSMGMMKSGVLHISRNTAPPGVRKRMSEQGRNKGSGAGKGKGGRGTRTPGRG